MNRGKLAVIPVTLFAFIIMSMACAVEQVERIQIGDTQYGVVSGTFGGKWFDYYERGASYIEGALVAMDAGDEATMKKAVRLGMADLQLALKGRDEDQRRARTYGMHTIDYFPNREMGIGHYISGELEQAKSKLEKSLSTVESSKAQFFMDRVRAKMIEQRGGDSINPEIRLGDVPPKTAAPELNFKITATDSGFVSVLVINDEEENIPLANTSIESEKTIALEEGENIIEITAMDLSGNVAEKTVKILCDTSGPTVAINESTMVPGSKARMNIKGWVDDPSGVKSIQLGELDLVPGADGSFGAVVKVDPDGKVKFEAIDSLGNKTAGAVMPGEEVQTEGRLPGSTLAGLVNRRNVIGPLVSRWVVESAQAAKKKGPSIRLKGLTSKQTVYFDSFYLEGVAYDPSGITKLVVGRKSLMKKPGSKIYFNYLRRLRAGRNRINIVGRNGLGEATQKRVTVTRRIPTVKRVGSRMIMSMLPFYLKGKVDKGEVAYDDLLKYIKRTGRFRLVDRTQMEKVVRELKLSQAGLTNQAGAVKAGKMAAAEVVLLGYVHETPGSIEVYSRVVNVETGEILTEKDAYTRRQPISLKKLMSLMRGLSIRLRNQFPMVEGQIATLRGTKVNASMKSRATLKPGTKLIIFRDKPVVHPKTKMPLGNQTVPIGEARIAKATGGQAAAILIDSKSSKKIRKSDKIITK